MWGIMTMEGERVEVGVCARKPISEKVSPDCSLPPTQIGTHPQIPHRFAVDVMRPAMLLVAMLSLHTAAQSLVSTPK